MGRGRVGVVAAAAVGALIILLWGSSSGGLWALGPGSGNSGWAQERATPTISITQGGPPTTASAPTAPTQTSPTTQPAQTETRTTTTPSPTTPSPPVTAPSAQQEGQGLSIGLPFLAVLAVTALVVGAVLVLWALLRTSGSRRRSTGPEQIDLLIDATSDARQEWVRGEADPRNAVVACWVQLEEAAGSGGLRRRRAETSTEFTVRVLARWEVPSEAIERLGGLFREARFSQHPVTEQMRHEAVVALNTINQVLLQARAVEQAQAEAGVAGHPEGRRW